MTSVFLTSNDDLIDLLRSCNVPQDRLFPPTVIDGVQYSARFDLDNRVYGYDELACELAARGKNPDSEINAMFDGGYSDTYHYWIYD